MAYDLEKEKREAREAGQRALQSLRTARESLGSARNWGVWDIVSGGFITSVIKRARMEKARQHVEQAKTDLRTFSRELQDVNLAGNLHIETNDFLSFADIFLDGMVVDFLVQDRIHKAAQQVDEAIRQVERALERL